MKTLWNNAIVDAEIHIDSDNISDGGTAIIKDKKKNVIGKVNIQGWDFYKYMSNPLYFIELSELTAEQKIEIIAQFDEWYGDTDQETTDWALEFQLVVRTILINYLVINTQYLLFDDEMYEILRKIIWEGK